MSNQTDEPMNGAGAVLPRLLDVGQAAKYIGLSRHTLYTMVSQRRIPYVKVGRLTKFDLKALDAWIKKHSVMPISDGRAA
jgi:excisionase family DNA binding protein